MPRNEEGEARRSNGWFRLLFALLAGTIAIAANMGLLATASALGIKTAHGSLLTLAVMSARNASAALHISGGGGSLALLCSATWFETVFHVMTGLLMAVLYAFLLERKLPGAPSARGTIFGITVWIFNAFVVLPLIGQAVAGHGDLTVPGMLCFGGAHMVFFILMSILYEQFSVARSRSVHLEQ